MFIDDEPKKPALMVIGEKLDPLSLAELAQRINHLEAEIVRVQAEIIRKQSSAVAADAFFRK